MFFKLLLIKCTVVLGAGVGFFLKSVSFIKTCFLKTAGSRVWVFITERLDCLFPSNVWFNSAAVDKSRTVSELQISVLAAWEAGRKRNDRLLAEKYNTTTISTHHIPWTAVPIPIEEGWDSWELVPGEMCTEIQMFSSQTCWLPFCFVLVTY